MQCQRGAGNGQVHGLALRTFGLQSREEKDGQQDGREVVDPQVLLVAGTLAFVIFESSPASVKNSNIDSRELGVNLFGEGLDLVVRAHVQFPDLDAGFRVPFAHSSGICFSLVG